MNEDLTPEEFLRLKEAGELWQLLDVREPWEVATASVPGSICIPMADVPDRRDELDERTPIAVLCHSGGRSAQVAAYLAVTGFDRVANIVGGIDEWAQQLDTTVPRY